MLLLAGNIFATSEFHSLPSQVSMKNIIVVRFGIFGFQNNAK